MKPTQERVQGLLHYFPETGLFHWKARRGGRAKAAGQVAGARCPDGYIKIGIDGGRYQAHRLAWLYVHGEWPAAQIDHVNGRRDDNRIANLREATNGQNQQNIGGPKRGNRAGFLGVTFHPQSGKYRGRLKVEGRVIDCGLHETPERAHEAYLAAKAKHHTHTGAQEAP